jgi:hypothetical protein
MHSHVCKAIYSSAYLMCRKERSLHGPDISNYLFLLTITKINFRDNLGLVQIRSIIYVINISIWDGNLKSKFRERYYLSNSSVLSDIIRIVGYYRFLTMVYINQDYRVFWTLSIVQYLKTLLLNRICFRLRMRGRRPTLLGPLERPSFNHWKAKCKQLCNWRTVSQYVVVSSPFWTRDYSLSRKSDCYNVSRHVASSDDRHVIYQVHTNLKKKRYVTLLSSVLVMCWGIDEAP